MPPDSVELPRALKPLLGTVVAKRYVVDGFLGMGGMAVVFSGRHATLDRKVAIKFMRPEYSLNADVSRRFDREARAASNFEHPNCIEVFDCGETSHGLKFIVMPLLEGVELGSVLGAPFPAPQAVWLGIQLLRGLEHAHSHGVVHRDLKPDNIFVTLDHERRELLKIVDFGIAKLLKKQQVSDGLQTKVGAIVGTPAYMSPEQAMGTGIDDRADLYSLGVILYHMLAGKAPFRAADPRGLLFQQVSMEAKPLPEEVPELVTRLVTALMAKERDDRPPSATAALGAFEHVWRQLQSDKTPWIRLVETRESAHPAARLPAPPPPSVSRTPSPPPAAVEPAAGGTQVYRPQDVPTSPERSPKPPGVRPAARGVSRPRGSSTPSRGSDPNKLDEMNAALRKFLDGQTITAEDNLRSGIFDVPDGGWGDEILLPGQTSNEDASEDAGEDPGDNPDGDPGDNPDGDPGNNPDGDPGNNPDGDPGNNPDGA